MMFQWLNDIIKIIATNPLTIVLIPIIATSILTYFFTKKNVNNDKQNEINQKSFDLVYLPLNIKFRDLPSYNLQNDKAKELHLELLAHYDEHIIYCSPIIRILLMEFKQKLEKDKNTSDIIFRLHSHVRDTYDKLRHKLNYPCIGFLDVIRYKSFGSVILFLATISLVIIILLLTTLSILIQYKFETIYVNYIAVAVAVLLFIIVVLILTYAVYLLSDCIFKFIQRKSNKSTSRK